MKAAEQQEIHTAMNSTMFARLARRWPEVKWIKMLLEPDPSIDKWMAAVLREFASEKDVCCSKCEWAIIHIIRVAGEKKLAVITDELIEIYNRYHEDGARLLVDATLCALEDMGPPAFDSVFKAFTNAKNDDVKTIYLGILSRLGVRDEKLKISLLKCYNLNPSYTAGSIADYGDKTFLPFLYGQMQDVVSILKKQIPTTRARSFELDLYVELREAIVNLEKGGVTSHLPFSLVDYYQRKEKPIQGCDSILDEKIAFYRESAKELDRRFFGYDVDLFPSGADEFDDDDDDRSEPGIEAPYRRDNPKIGRNDPCPCGSGKKFKKCCFEKLH